MANGSQPGWLGGALVFFSLTTAVAFGFWVHLYTQHSALNEQRVVLRKVVLPDLETQSDQLDPLIEAAENELVAKQERLQSLNQANEDARTINKNLLEAETVQVNQIQSHTQKITRDFRTALEEAKEARAEHNAQEKEVLNITAELEKRLVSLRALIKEESQGIESYQENVRGEFLALDRGNAKLEERVQELLDQQEISRAKLLADGKVLAARASEGFVVMDLGRKDGLRLGTVFKVFARSGGQNIVKGSVEVTKVGDNQSEGHVIEEISIAEPIIPGDSLHNPVFNPVETKVFVIDGIFRNFTKSELARFITDAGGVVEQNLSTKTHYLIAGANSETALSNASKFGITILSEDQLIDFIRPKEISR